MLIQITVLSQENKKNEKLVMDQTKTNTNLQAELQVKENKIDALNKMLKVSFNKTQ